MSNQMKKILMLSLVLSGTVFFSCLVFFLINGQFLSFVSYVVLALSGASTIMHLCLYLMAKKEEKEFKNRIAYFKTLNILRESAVLDFYNKFGIKPQYNKDGRLLLPDEVLGILTKLDESGNLDPSIYEKLGILPMFDANGKEIPQILVLKHLIRSIKKDGLKDIPKLKGLYKKGTKQEKAKTDSKKPDKKAEKKSSKSKSAKTNKINRYGSKDVIIKSKGFSKKDDKKSSSNGDKQVISVVQAAKPKEIDKKEESRVEKIDIQDEIKKRGSDYLSKMYNKKPEPKPEREAMRVSPVEEEFGEGTLE